ncbi:MAG TPA: response regulator transcription factor [Actinomycetota bacterium]|nr:response regulator transcription factor [Actinomycetota bacterium]
MKVLVIEDDRQIVRTLQTSLEARGYDVVSARDGQSGLGVLRGEGADLVLLDLGLPDVDGLKVLSSLRSFAEQPVIVLTVRDSQAEKVAALDTGADDYITKPFDMDELLARMRAALRRVTPEEIRPSVRTYGKVQVDLARQLVTKEGHRIHLTPTEFVLLQAFVRNAGKLLTQRWLLKTVWGPGYEEETNVRVHVGHLRRKLEDDATNPRLILTEPGLGYRWSDEAG